MTFSGINVDFKKAYLSLGQNIIVCYDYKN